MLHEEIILVFPTVSFFNCDPLVHDEVEPIPLLQIDLDKLSSDMKDCKIGVVLVKKVGIISIYDPRFAQYATE